MAPNRNVRTSSDLNPESKVNRVMEQNPLKKTGLTRSILILFATGIFLTACGKRGACITGNDICYEGWDETDCGHSGWTFYKGTSCSDNGYSKPCSEDRKCYCHSWDPYCP